MQNRWLTRFRLAALLPSAGLGLLIALCLFLPGARAQGSSEIQFAPIYTPVGTPGYDVYNMAAADLDHDGDQDLVVTPFGVELWRNNGDGTWTRMVTWTYNTGTLVLGDLDNDGHTDIAFQDGTYVTVLRNAGTPWDKSTWWAATVGQVSGLCRDLEMADFDGDGYLDLVTADQAGPIQIWRNNGTPFVDNWASTQVGSVGSALWTLAVGDLDNDGDVDIATGNKPSNMYDFTLWQNDGTPFDSAWAGNPSPSFYQQPLDMAAGDLDRDGALDIVLYTGGAVRACRNDRSPFTGEWPCAIVFSIPTSGFRLVLADADNDGDLDIFSGDNQAGSNLHVWTNDGTPFSGSWTGATVGALGGSIEALAVSDLDGDGDPDVAAGNRYSTPRILAVWDNILVHHSRPGYLPFDPPTTLTSGAMDYAYAVTTADLDNDGDLDSVLGQYHGLLLVRHEDGATRFLGDPNKAIYDVDAADVDADGDLDLVVGRDVTTDNLQIWTNPLDGGGDIWAWDAPWSQITAGTAHGMVYNIAVVDLDRDGDLDIATGSDATAENVQVWQHDGDPIAGVWTASTVFTATERVTSLAAGDLDHDGRADLAVGTSGVFAGDLMACPNDGLPFAGPWNCSYVGSVAGSTVRSLALADLDGDGALDLVSASYRLAGNPNLHAWRNDGSPFTDPWTSLGIAEASGDLFSVALGDLNADGAPDVVGAGIGTGNLTAWCSDGTPFDAGSWTPLALDAGTDHYGRVVTLADVNRDGRLDVVGGVFDWDPPSSDYALQVWHNAGTPVTVAVTDTAPALMNPNDQDDLLIVTITHNGVSGDSEVEPAWWDVQWTTGSGTPLTTTQAQDLFAFLDVHRESGVTPGFQSLQDPQVLSLDYTAFALSGGVQRLTFPDGQTLSRIGAGEAATYYLAVTMRPAGGPLAPTTFRAILDPDDGVRAENEAVDANLLVQAAAMVQSGVVSVQNNPPVLSGIAAAPELVKQGGVITVTTSGASDPDGDPLALRCGTASGSGDLGAGAYGPGERTLAFTAPWTGDSEHTIWCVVTDGGLASAEYSAAVTADNTLPVVSLSAPPGGVVWQGGLEYAVTWSAADSHLSPDPIGLAYSLDGGVTWALIAAGIANSGVYSWTPPVTSTAQAHVQVQAVDEAGNAGTATSAAFSLDTPPAAPSSPTPASGATDVSVDTLLSWVCSDADGDVLTFDIYLGTAADPPLVESGWSGTSYDPGPLQPGQVYYWRIVAGDGILDREGALWHLTTAEEWSVYLPVVLKAAP